MFNNEARKNIERLQSEPDEMMVRFARFSYALAEEFRARVIRNIDDTFGARAKNASKAQVRKMSGRKLGASGNLRNSVMLTSSGPFSFRVTVGNEQVPYASIHEYGGTIYPRRAKWLTIPASNKGGNLDFFNEITSGHRAREFDLFRVGRGLFFRSEHRQARRRGLEGSLAYLLAKQATIPARPYFRPAIASLENDVEFQQRQLLIAGFDPTMWRVRQ
jgi:phage gpG-like protein